MERKTSYQSTDHEARDVGDCNAKFKSEIHLKDSVSSNNQLTGYG